MQAIVRQTLQSCHVSIADCCHGDQGPPQTERDAVKVVVRIGLNPLGVVDETGKDDDTQDLI